MSGPTRRAHHVGPNRERGQPAARVHESDVIKGRALGVDQICAQYESLQIARVGKKTKNDEDAPLNKLINSASIL